MIMPPFVGAIGLRQLLARFGSVNLLLMELGLLPPDAPDRLAGAGRLLGHRDAAGAEPLPDHVPQRLRRDGQHRSRPCARRRRTSGAGGWRLFRTITLPLILPGYFAGAIIVFIWAFTDLGTPLIFGFSRVVPVQIFDAVNELNTNPMGYALVVFVLAAHGGAVSCVSKQVLAGRRYEMMARGHTAGAEARATRPADARHLGRRWAA